MAEDSIELMKLVEKYTDGELFRELGEYILQRLRFLLDKFICVFESPDVYVFDGDVELIVSV